MAKKGLEKVVVGNIVSRTMQKFLGVTIDELNKDITEKISKSPLIDFEIDIKTPFKSAIPSLNGYSFSSQTFSKDLLLLPRH